jgi:hypothetical protein
MIHAAPAHIVPEPAPAPAPATAPARALIEGQMAMLSRLAEIGMEVAEACGRDARNAAAAKGDARPIGLVFARVARAVRMTIALQSRLMKDLAALDRADTIAERAQRDRRRMRLSRLVDEAARAALAARREAGSQYWADDEAMEDEVEQLASEAYERLTDAEDDDLTGLSFNEAVAGVAADLGLTPDWTARLLTAMAAPPDPSTDPAPPDPVKARPEDKFRAAGGGPSMMEAHAPQDRPWPPPCGPPPAVADAMGEVGTGPPKP